MQNCLDYQKRLSIQLLKLICTGSCLICSKLFFMTYRTKLTKIKPGDYITDVNNPNITKHKGHLPKRLKSNIEQSSSKGKQVLRNSTHINVIDNNEINAEGEGSGDIINTKGRKCGKCKKYGHYAKTCEAKVL